MVVSTVTENGAVKHLCLDSKQLYARSLEVMVIGLQVLHQSIVIHVAMPCMQCPKTSILDLMPGQLAAAWQTAVNGVHAHGMPTIHN